jgi:predicted membrane-bound spermidine synthase
MGLEMCASRLLAPYFGDSLPVWGLLIGLLLAYLSIGYLLGGRLADRYPRASLLYRLAAWAGFAIGLTPYLARPILRYSVIVFGGYHTGAVLASLLSILALFAVPAILLGCVSPFAIRLSVEDAGSSGNVAGRIYALSTTGSLIGTFAPVFLLIPNLGTRRAIEVISLSLLAVAVVGLFQTDRRRALFYALLPISILALHCLPMGAVKPTEGMIYETDSAYNYIQVIQKGGEVLLKLNEGEGIQSSYLPGRVLSGYVYDYFLLVPFLRNRQAPSPPVDSMCLIGLAGGTVARQYAEVFGAPSIDGIEIDPAIVRVGQRFFDLDVPNMQVFVKDGRYYLAHTTRIYDIVIIDAYRPPYIPFHLTTVEFFRLVREHLKPDGVVAINVARTETDYRLVDAVASTLKAVYPGVFIIDTLSDLNSVVVATCRTVDLSSLTARLDSISHPVVRDVVWRAKGGLREFVTPTREALTDDHAPVEQIVHAGAIRYLLGQQVHEEHP